MSAGNGVGAQKGINMARTRYQKGSLSLIGPEGRKFWQGRYRESYFVTHPKTGKKYRPDRKVLVGWETELPTRKLAQREFDRRFLNAVNDVSAPQVASTFKAHAEWWMNNTMLQFTPSTQPSMRSVTKKHLIPYFGDRLLLNVGAEQLQEFVTCQTVSPKSIKNMVRVFLLIWKSAIARGFVSHEPARAVRLPKVHKKQAPAFTADEARRIIQASEEPFHTMYRIAACLGLRGCEICGLRVRSLDFLNHQVRVTESAWGGEIGSPKTGNAVRVFTMPPELESHLVEFVRGKNPDDLLFSKEGKPYWQESVVRTHIKPLLKRLRICCDIGMEGGVEVVTVKPDYGLHAFRHLNATLLDRAGAPAAVRKARLGHGDLSTTMGYTHLESSDDARAAQAVESLLMERVQ